MRTRLKLTYANVTATIALVLAIGGGVAYAALERNSVKARQIAPDSVATSELRIGAVERENLDYDAVASPEIVDRSVGAQEQPGLVEVESTPVTLGPFGSGASVQTTRAECGSAGEVVSGGHSSGIRTFISYSQRSGNGWAIIGVNSNEHSAEEMKAVAYCRPFGEQPAPRRDGPTAAEREELREALAEARANQRALAD
jgi:hypothetical protein